MQEGGIVSRQKMDGNPGIKRKLRLWRQCMKGRSNGTMNKRAGHKSKRDFKGRGSFERNPTLNVLHNINSKTTKSGAAIYN